MIEISYRRCRRSRCISSSKKYSQCSKNNNSNIKNNFKIKSTKKKSGINTARKTTKTKINFDNFNLNKKKNNKESARINNNKSSSSFSSSNTKHLQKRDSSSAKNTIRLITLEHPKRQQNDISSVLTVANNKYNKKVFIMQNGCDHKNKINESTIFSSTTKHTNYLTNVTNKNLNNISHHNINIMGDKVGGGGGPVTPRKRGHQHHPRNIGVRRSNVPVDEVIAVLRGETLSQNELFFNNGSSNTINNTNNINNNVNFNEKVLDLNKNIVCEKNVEIRNIPPDGGETTTTTSSTSSAITPTTTTTTIKSIDCDNNNNNKTPVVITNVITPTTTVQQFNNNKPTAAVLQCIDNNNNNQLTTKSSQQFEEDGVVIKNKTNKLKNKVPSNKNSNKTKASLSTGGEQPSQQQQRRKKQKPSSSQSQQFLQQNIPKEERPPLEGAASDDHHNDENDDPDNEEWSKLRCTSERTEVIAARESHQRQNRRCADYPGLAFGRSIFSSDTMMKFSIIRNELHNIMKTQLKRNTYENRYLIY